ncbi:PREDICTED: protein FAR1-RELATED SEQUENCE 5-like [Ipomoea nil]|uniref:protein FAR1-RELATED SEQUENCE 5-like n=1 Tax=Ipomoea nil TaxID=35883 RepID=UPI000901FBD1|nr:PREDICTED: protein FAR1-RELATED SEQUENCE 5-like [Ipomoea nil]
MAFAFYIGFEARSESLQGCVMDVSPDGTKFWTPSCDEAVRLFEGQTFLSLAHGIDFYRQNREGVVVKDLLVCSREGFKQAVQGSVVIDAASDQAPVAPKRRRVSNRVGCRAMLVLKMVDDGVFVVHFIEHRHNHCLCSDVAKPFLRDAHIVVKKYVKKVGDCPDYVFRYDVDSQDQLCRAFWADPIAKENFSAFGEVVSFDATYGTNRYGMVLVPFTGVDNHKRGVTFAMGLISREDVDSYVWLLQQFKSAMGCVPSCTITDQDPSMRVAVPQVFDTTRHRFCMWHIMSKVSEKVGNVLSKDEEFRRALNDVAWCETLSVEEFERGWQDVIEKYSLGDHRWFCLMYELRSYWILVYFNDIFIGGLLRMTSRSEAANSVFGSCTNQHASLFELFNNFEGAIDAQRLAQAKLNAECEGHFPLCQIPLLIEKHAAAVYTVNVFYDVQAEVIAGSFSCRSVRSNVEGMVTWYEVQDGDELVFKDRRVVSIPSRYLIARWTMGACVRQVLGVQCGGASEVDVAIGEAWADFFSCVTMASRSVDHVSKLNAALKDFNAFLLAENGPSVRSSSSKKQLFESFCGASPDGQVDVRPPPISNNKGGGKRYKSTRELAIEKSGHRQRQCQTCEKYGHNSRTCPMRNVDV